MKPIIAPAIVSNQLIPSEKSIPEALYDLGPDGQVFSQPVKITLLYPTPENGMDENMYRIFWYDGKNWRYIGGNVDTAKNTVTAWVNHFSKFGVFEVVNTITINAQSYKPQEKILTLNKDGLNDVAYFSGLQTANFLTVANGGNEVVVKIYNIRNQLIRKLVDTEIWDGTNDSGNVVENGVYIYQYELNGEKVSGTIIIAK